MLLVIDSKWNIFQSFNSIARLLGDGLKEQPQLRPTICRSLRLIIETSANNGKHQLLPIFGLSLLYIQLRIQLNYPVMLKTTCQCYSIFILRLPVQLPLMTLTLSYLTVSKVTHQLLINRYVFVKQYNNAVSIGNSRPDLQAGGGLKTT